MQKSRQTFLLRLRKRWDPDQKLQLSTFGKRQHERASGERNPSKQLTDDRIRLLIWVGGRPVEALVVTGAATSFINPGTATLFRRNQWHTNVEYLAAAMANGGGANIDESMGGTVKVMNRNKNHVFYVIGSLLYPMVLGRDFLRKVDYQATCFGTPIVQGTTTETQPPCHTCYASEGLAPRNPDEAEIIKDFLSTDLPKFDSIGEPTPLIKHHIKLIDKIP